MFTGITLYAAEAAAAAAAAAAGSAINAAESTAAAAQSVAAVAESAATAAQSTAAAAQSTVAAAQSTVAAAQSTVAAAESTAAVAAGEGAITAGAGVIGFLSGVTFMAFLMLLIIWLILQILADWRIFSKAGIPGFLSFIPIVNVIAEYNLCWNGLFGLAYMVCTFVSMFLMPEVSADNVQQLAAGNWRVILSGILSCAALVLHIIQSFKLSKSFGKGIGFGFVLLLLGPIGRVILGIGESQYVGKA